MAESGGPRCKLINLIKEFEILLLHIFLRFGLMGQILTVVQRVFIHVPLLLVMVFVTMQT